MGAMGTITVQYVDETKYVYSIPLSTAFNFKTDGSIIDLLSNIQITKIRNYNENNSIISYKVLATSGRPMIKDV